jgi:hypothetical protein
MIKSLRLGICAYYVASIGRIIGKTGHLLVGLANLGYCLVGLLVAVKYLQFSFWPRACSNGNQVTAHWESTTLDWHNAGVWIVIYSHISEMYVIRLNIDWDFCVTRANSTK